jgi:hypothetical protein
MSVKFTGFSGLQTNPQHTLLINQDTWCVSFFFRLAAGSSTDSQLLNQTYLMTCQPAYPQATTITGPGDVQQDVTPTPDVVMRFSLTKAYDPSLVGIFGEVGAGMEWATTYTSGVDAFASHHVLMYGVPTTVNEDGTNASQGLFMFVDANPVDVLDQDIGVGHMGFFSSGNPSAIDPYFPADTSKNPDFSIRLGNPNMIQLWPGWFGSAYYPGQVSYSLEHFAIWHGWTPQAADIVALRDRSQLPGDFATGLQIWWKLDSTSGDVTGSDTALQNAASSGEHDLHIV